MRFQSKFLLVFCCLLVSLLVFWINGHNSPFLIKRIKERERSQPVRQPKDEHKPHDKWIVTTSGDPSFSSILTYATFPGWKTLVVAERSNDTDTGFPKCIQPDCTFLSMDEQNNLKYSIVHKMLNKDRARKNIGYLYAIENGAKIIYDTDSSSSLNTLQTFKMTKEMNGLMYACPKLFNPCRHFGQPSLWPRGYPIDDDDDMMPSDAYRIGSGWKTPLVQQGMINGDPDTAAVFQLSRKRNSRGHVMFDPVAPPTILPYSTFCPLNSQNTLFHRDALWALLLPVTPSSRAGDVWRGYWLQRLLWEISEFVGVFAPNAYRSRQFEQPVGMLKEEMLIYSTTTKLLEFLSRWKCPSQLTFFGCMRLLSSDMEKHQFWGKEDVELIDSWVRDLAMLGYPEPQRFIVIDLDKESNNSTSSQFEFSVRRNLTLSQGTHTSFTSAMNGVTKLDSTADASGIGKVRRFVIKGISLCRERHVLFVPSPSFAARMGQHYQKILLVVAISGPLMEQYIDAVITKTFTNIAFCSDTQTAGHMQLKMSSVGHKVTFIHVKDTDHQSVKALCAIRAMEMGYSVDGFLVMGSDVLLNLKQIRYLHKNRVWLDQNLVSFFQNAKNISTVSESGTNYTSSDLLSLSSLGNQDLRHKRLSISIKEAIKALSNETRHVGNVFYVPTHLVNDVLFYFHTFKEQRATNGNASIAAVRSVLLCNDFEYLTGNDYSQKNSTILLRQINPKVHFLAQVKTKHELRRLCHSYLFP